MCSEGIFDRYVYFYTDFAFKKLFGTEMNKELLISFLNALLEGREVIQDITYLNSEQFGTQEYDRRAVFDVYCRNEQGEYFVVEMQKNEQQFFKDRSLYYSTFAIREQAPKGVWNYELKGIYTIGILNFKLPGKNPSYRHEVKLMNTATKEVFYDKLTLIYLEMPKFTKTIDELDTLFDKWMYAIKNLGKLMERPPQLRERIFSHLFEAAEIARFDKVERVEYEESLKVYRDWVSVLETAENKGRAIGLEKGLEQGRKEGREEGRKEGREEGRKESYKAIARNMLDKGMSVEDVKDLTGLSDEVIIQLRDN